MRLNPDTIICNLKLTGYSCRSIANELSRLQVKSPYEGGCWRAEGVARRIDKLRESGRLPPNGVRVKAPKVRRKVE